MNMEKNYRGKGVSRTKTCKGTDIPKHSGNYSYSAIHAAFLQSKEYRVTLQDHHLIVGESTPLAEVFEPALLSAIESDPYFESYTQRGVKTVGNKQYDAQRTLTKYKSRYNYLNNIKYLYREQIYTDGDFDYNFPNY